jgi:hypothetical protein
MMKVCGFLVFAPLLVAALSLVVMLLWNALIPALFAGPVLTFWQAVGLLVLCRVLFGGFRPHHRGHHHWKHRAAWRDRWHRMSPEERDRFRDGFRRWKDMSRDERREFRRGFGHGPFGGPFGPCGPSMHDEPPGLHGEQGSDERRGV